MALRTFLPQDRLRAIARKETLPDRANGSALLADISGFTPLTEKLTRNFGTRRGIEALAQQINIVYDAMIREIEHFGGSVISFAGDAITCWFDESIGDPSNRAVQCAGAMQKAMNLFPELSLKIAVCTGPVRRFAIGDATIQLIDTLAGATITSLSIAEHTANAGEIILDQKTTARVDLPDLPQRTSETNETFSILAPNARHRIQNLIPIKTEDFISDTPIDADLLKPWVLPMVFEKEGFGHELLLTELRPTVALFIRFTGIDYDNDPLAGGKLNQIISLAQQALDRHEGSLLELTIGDKGSYIYASFGATRIHENDAQRAIRAALEIKNKISEEDGSKILQFGITSGTMRVGGYGGSTRKSFSALGNSVNLAARLMMAAAPGEILISSRVQKSSQGEFIVDARPPRTFKGWQEPISIFAVLGLQQYRAVRLREPSYQLPMIGRTDELHQIAERLELAANGYGQIVGVTGEAGLGKSRLIAEGIRLSRRRNFIGYGGTCQSDGVNNPYTVWNAIWNALFDLDPATPLRKQIRALESELEDLLPEYVDSAPLLGPILGLSIPDNESTRLLQPSDRKNQLETILLKLLEAFAKESAENGGGLLLVLEDLHWIDPVSLDLLAQVARIVEKLPVLILLTYRRMEPDFRGQSFFARLNELKHFTRLELGELNPSESEQVIRAKLSYLFPEQRGGIPGILIERITKRAQGNPFYVEELLNYMHDRGIDPRDGSALSAIELPTSLHSLILSRIDHLTTSQQHTLKAASIVGRVFRFDHLHKYYPSLGNVNQVKSDLQEMDRLNLILLESPEPELTYLFRHLIIHEVAYESIAYATRSKLHEQYAEFLEQSYPEQIERLIPQLAHHYEKAEVWKKAQHYLTRAGEQAAANYANDDALSYFNRALKLSANEGGHFHFDILMKRERVYDLLGNRAQQRHDLENLAQLADGFEDSLSLRAQIALREAKLEIDEGDYQAAKSIARSAIRDIDEKYKNQEGLPELHVDALLLEARAMFLAGQAAAARPQLDSALALARAHGYTRGEYNALAQLGLWNWYNGDNRSAIEVMEHSLELIRQAGDIRREADILNNLGIATKDMYRFEDSLVYYERAQKISKKIGDRSGEASLLNNMGRASINSGSLVTAIKYCSQAAVLASETNDPTVQGLALHNKSEALRELGQYTKARETAEESIRLLRSSGYKAGEGWAMENLAMTEFFHGNHSKALELAEQALAISREITSRRLEVSVLTRIGLMRLGMGQLDRAEESLHLAEKIEAEFNDLIPVFEIQAGLAGVALARGSNSMQKAGDLIIGLRDELLQDPPSDQSHILPMGLYLICIRVLQALADPRSEAMTSRSYKELMMRSDKITDADLRAGFLKIHEHQFIIAYASTHLDSTL